MKRTADDVTALLDEHGGRLFALLYRLTLRSDVAEDLLQELFCRLSQSNGFQRAENPAAFAYRTATNLAFDWRRQRKRNPAANRINDEFVAPEGSPLSDLVRREDLERTLNALANYRPPAAKFSCCGICNNKVTNRSPTTWQNHAPGSGDRL